MIFDEKTNIGTQLLKSTRLEIHPYRRARLKCLACYFGNLLIVTVCKASKCCVVSKPNVARTT